MNLYRLYREPGLIIFNSFKEGEKYWITYQAAALSGRAMYDEITQAQFEDIIHNRSRITDLYKGLTPRPLNYAFEQNQENTYGLLEAIDRHNLSQYRQQPTVYSEVEG